MEFVNPGFLYGLFAVSIPIIIHLFNFRRFKKVYFTNVSFIKDLKQQTQKQSRLKHLLVLIMRILVIICIVLAFAKPFIPVSENIIQPYKKNAVSIFVDNSFSLQAESERGTLLDEAKEKAKEIASVYKSSDLFQLLTNDFEGRHQRFVSKDEFVDWVDEVRISPVVKTISEVVTRQEAVYKDNLSATKTAYVISDFQKSVLDENFTESDSLIKTFLIPIKSINQDNLYIDSCWFESPVQQLNQSVDLHVRIRNNSNNNFEKIPVKLNINGRQRSLASFDIGSKGTSDVVLAYTNYEAGIQYGELKITDYPVTFDDDFYFSYSVSDITKILSINGNGPNGYLNALFNNDSSFIFSNVNEGNIDYSSLASNQLIILNELDEISSGLTQELKQFVENGGSLVVLPAIDLDFENYNEFLRNLDVGYYSLLDTTNTRVSYINLEHPLYSDVFEDIPENIDLPVVFVSYRIVIETTSRQESLLELQTGQPFLNVFNSGRGKVYLFAVPFQTSFSNFPKHAVFVPTMYKIAISSVFEDNLYYTIGENEVITVRNINLGADNVLSIRDLQSEFEFIPEHRRVNSHLDIFSHGQITMAGNYTLFNSETALKGIAFNFNRTESELVFFTVNEIKAYLDDQGLKNFQIVESADRPFVQTLSDLSLGKQLWRWFVMLALLFLLGEVLLLRFWK